MIRLLIIASLLLTSCSLKTDPQTSVTISNFKSGLVCPANTTDSHSGQTSGIGDGSICEDAKRIVITGKQACILNGQSLPCTWYGYEFNYENMPETGELSCEWTSSHPIQEGNPEKIRAEDTQHLELKLSLTPGTGHFYNPLYGVFTEGLPKDITIVDKTICRVGKREVFRVNFEIVHPQNTSYERE